MAWWAKAGSGGSGWRHHGGENIVERRFLTATGRQVQGVGAGEVGDAGRMLINAARMVPARALPSGAPVRAAVRVRLQAMIAQVSHTA